MRHHELRFAELLASTDPRAQFSLDHFVYHVGVEVGRLTAALCGPDAFILTAGIGENSPVMWARIGGRLAWLGCVVDPDANAEGRMRIGTPESVICLYVIATDEELMITHHTVALLKRRGVL